MSNPFRGYTIDIIIGKYVFEWGYSASEKEVDKIVEELKQLTGWEVMYE